MLSTKRPFGILFWDHTFSKYSFLELPLPPPPPLCTTLSNSPFLDSWNLFIYLFFSGFPQDLFSPTFCTILLLFLSHHDHDFLLLIFTCRFSLLSMWWLLCIISKGFSLQKCSKLLLPLLYLLACKLLLFSFFNIFMVDRALIWSPFLLHYLFLRVVCCAVIAVLVALVASSPTKGWSGRSLSLLDP